MQGWRLRGATPVMVRPIVPADALQLGELVTGLTPRDRRWRFHGGVNGLTHARLHAMCSPGQAEVALVATVDGTMLADARCVIDASGEGAEFGLMVAQGWRRQGLASRCLAALASAAAARGVLWLHGTVMADNAPTLALLRRHGYQCAPSREDAALVSVERRVAVVAAPAA